MRSKLFSKAKDSFQVWAIFLLGLWFSVIKVFGPGFSLIPGDLGDNRFNNYILEHFYRWISGLDPTYWTARFFYPFPNTIAFSDNLLGSAVFYAFFRRLGLDRETAFQAWYILGFLFNYAAAVYVLDKLKFKPLAVGVGAFFFSFGLPLMAEENHAQLIYRFGIPLACYFLWEFSERPKLSKLFGLGLSVVWQFYLAVYNGIFLAMLLAVMVVLRPFFTPSRTWMDRFNYWPRRLIVAWRQTSPMRRICFLGLLLGLGVSLYALLLPYYTVTKIYGFSRGWSTVQSMLPRLQSFFLADGSLIWGGLSQRLQGVPMRWEHQLFPGLAVVLLVLTGLVWRPKSENRGIAWLHLWAMLALVGIIFWFQGFSIYRLVWLVPGLNSIRAVTRIGLVLMWPAAIFMAYVLDSLLNVQPGDSRRYARFGSALFLIGLLCVETLAYNHITFSKVEAQNRLSAFKAMVPVDYPQDPVLILSGDKGQPWYANEIDAMLVAQDLGWPVLNGYSGNSPENYGPTVTCRVLPKRIASYMHFAHISDENFYFEMMKRVVPVGFDDCRQAWWTNMP
jgi:hypothetical protein